MFVHPKPLKRLLKISVLLWLFSLNITKGICQDGFFESVVQPSPTVSKFGKFGDMPIDLKSGAARAAIPLYDLKIRDNYALGFNLIYSTSGVKVDEMAGNVGTDWSMSGEYAIRRVVFDDPDETSRNLTHVLDGGYNKDSVNKLIFYGRGARSDMQPDMYTLITPDFSGRFYMDDGKAVFLNKNTSYKVEYIPIYGWKVLDGKGNVLLFGGNAIEKTRVRSSCLNQFNDPLDAYFNPTAWFIQSIVTPKKDTLRFEYTPVNYNYISRVNNSKVIDKKIDYTGNCGCDFSDLYCRDWAELQSFALTAIKTNGNATITFTTMSRADNLSAKLVKRMNIYANVLGTDSLLRYVDFSYSYGRKKKRPYLTRVGIYEGTRKDSMVYRMEYNHPDDLPDMLDPQTDAWGYYNASGQAVNNAPNSNVGYYGTLSRITFPTGGYNTVEYEPNLLSRSHRDPRSKQIAFLHGYGKDDHTLVTYSTTQTISKAYGNIEISGYTQFNSTQPPTDLLDKMIVTIRNHATGAILYSTTIFPSTTSPFSTNLNRTSIGTGNWYPSGTESLVIDCELGVAGEREYGEVVMNMSWTEVNIYDDVVGGSRVKRITSVNSTGAPIIKAFDYNVFGKTGLSSGQVAAFADFTEEISTYSECSSQSHATCYTKRQYNKSLVDVFAYGDAPVYYTDVTEKMGNNSENGCIRHIFDLRLPSPGSRGINSAANYGTTSLLMLVPFNFLRDPVAFEKSVTYYKKVGDDLKMVKSLEHTMLWKDDASRTQRYGYSLRQRKFSYLEHFETEYDYYDVFQYSILSSWFGVSSTKETMYTDDNKQFFKKTDYYFENYPANTNTSRMEYTDSKGNTYKKVLKYATDLAGQEVYDSMIRRNMVDVPLIEEEYNNDQLLNQSVSNYSFSTAQKDLITLSSVQIKNGNNPAEQRYLTTKVDNYGNILERNKVNDLTEVYLWGYNHQYPVAKVLGTSYSTVAALVNQRVLDNPSSHAAVQNEIEKVRTGLSSSSAQVNSYSYIPLVGMTTEKSPGGILKSYEYVNLSMLEVIRDQYRNIIKQYVYKYHAPDDPFYLYANSEQKQAFYKDNCGTGGRSEEAVVYIVPEGKYTSNTNQKEADDAALQEISDYGLQNARDLGMCVYDNDELKQSFTRSDCATDGVGGTVTYTVPKGTYQSYISVADANKRAQADIDANGLNYANAHGTCTFSNKLYSQDFQKQCPSDGVGSTVNYGVAAGKYSSTISQADADAKAKADVDQNGQNNANTKGHCVYTNTLQSLTYTKECTVGGVGSQVTLSLAPGSFYSWISTQDANDTAIAYIKKNGQANANSNGYCTWSNVYTSRCGAKSCSNGYKGVTVCYPVAAGTYTSNISQADADAKATADLNQNAAAYIASHSNCVCTGEAYKVIGNSCVAGTKVYTGGKKVGSTYVCYYHYEWSDGTSSAQYNESSGSPCPATPL